MSLLTNDNFSRRRQGRVAEFQSNITSQSMYANTSETLTPPLSIHNESDLYAMIKKEEHDSQPFSESLHHDLRTMTEMCISGNHQHLDEYDEESLTMPFVVQPQSLFLHNSHNPNNVEGTLETGMVFAMPHLTRFPASYPMMDYLSDSTICERNLTPFSSNSSDYFVEVNQDFSCSDEPWSEQAEKPSPASISRCEASQFEGDSVYDKPYARLIWEALMQAPGHRMMLREIYDWFVQNTNKPRESGTNGWQNSIRHNLSMNQAFENDKSDPHSRGSKKANSVWMLTDHAVRHGVQSTTRFRKQTLGKKLVINPRPAVQRQRSGAKGGRAARRAARLRKREETQTVEWPYERSPVSMVSEISCPSFVTQNYSPLTASRTSPPTPPEHQNVGMIYSLPTNSFYQYDAGTMVKYDTNKDPNGEERPKVYPCPQVKQPPYSARFPSFR